MNKNYLYLGLAALAILLLKGKSERDETTDARENAGSGLTPDKDSESDDAIVPDSVETEPLEFNKNATVTF